jgi:hypothetical protein
LDLLVIVADHLVRIPRPWFEGREKPYCTLDELARLIERHPGKSGSRLARNALELARVGADSPPETRLRLALLRADLPEPLLNCPIVDEAGNVWHSPDMSLPKYRIAIEYEGDPHNQPKQVRRDIRRAENVAAARWDEIRISGDHMLDRARSRGQDQDEADREGLGRPERVDPGRSSKRKRPNRIDARCAGPGPMQRPLSPGYGGGRK